jgi:hypothetical protein
MIGPSRSTASTDSSSSNRCCRNDVIQAIAARKRLCLRESQPTATRSASRASIPGLSPSSAISSTKPTTK